MYILGEGIPGRNPAKEDVEVGTSLAYRQEDEDGAQARSFGHHSDHFGFYLVLWKPREQFYLFDCCILTFFVHFYVFCYYFYVLPVFNFKFSISRYHI